MIQGAVRVFDFGSLALSRNSVRFPAARTEEDQSQLLDEVLGEILLGSGLVGVQVEDVGGRVHHGGNDQAADQLQAVHRQLRQQVEVAHLGRRSRS